MPKPRRRRLILGVLALGLRAGVALTAPPAQAVNAVSPYYALPSWDRKMGVGKRFVVLTNWSSQAVLDKETGLVWEQSPQPVPTAWVNARFACTGKTTGNRKGWRLPSVHELASLVDPAQSNPALPLSHPFTVLSANYWSATPHAEFSTNAWIVLFFNGSMGFASKTNNFLVWCVRGGMNVDVY